MIAFDDRCPRVSMLFAGLFLGLATTIGAQLPLAFEYTGSPANARCGSAVTAIGDVNGDGVADLAVGEPCNAGPSGGANARVRVLSGANGSQLYAVTQLNPADHFGFAVAATGDLDGDGVPDFVVGAPRAIATRRGAVYGYSGASGSLLFTTTGGATDDQLGTSVVAIGDVDGDGVTDLLAGAPLASYVASQAGRAQVISGATGTILRTHDGTTMFGKLGLFLAPMDDLDGDGVKDYAIADPFAPSPQGVGVGLVRVHSGASGTLLYQLSDPSTTNYVWSMAPIGDLDGDGVDDLLIGDYRDTGPHGLNSESGRIRVISGLSGGLIHEIFGFLEEEALGRTITGINDLDGDGLDDIVALSSYQQSIPHPIQDGIRVFSGADGDFLFGQAASTGRAVCSIPDLDGDGLDDIAVGRPWEDAPMSESGKLTVFLSKTATADGLGTGQANRTSAALFVNGNVTYGNRGPFVHLTPSGTVMTMDFIGLPYALFDLYVSPTLSPSAWNYPGFGTLDIGTPPNFTDVTAAIQGLSAGQVLYACNASGAGRLTMTIPPNWPSGLLGCVQGLMQIPQPAPNEPWARLTAAHQIFVN